MMGSSRVVAHDEDGLSKSNHTQRCQRLSRAPFWNGFGGTREGSRDADVVVSGYPPSSATVSRSTMFSYSMMYFRDSEECEDITISAQGVASTTARLSVFSKLSQRGR